MLEAAPEPVKPQSGDFTIIHADQSKPKSVQGGIITLAAQGLSFVLQTGTLMILARLLSPKTLGCRNGRCYYRLSRSFQRYRFERPIVHETR